MIRSLWIAKTGLDAQQTNMDVIANNLANVNTTGFKRQRAVFEDLMYQTVRQPGALSSEQTTLPSGLQIGTGSELPRLNVFIAKGIYLKLINPPISRLKVMVIFIFNCLMVLMLILVMDRFRLTKIVN